MKNFVIKKLDGKLELETFNYNIKGFHYLIKNSEKYMSSKEIVMVHPRVIDTLISNSFQRKYNKILAFLWNVVQNADESSGGNLMIVLDEIARLRSILLRKYNDLLSKEKLDELLKQLKLLENEVRSKIFNYQLIKKQELVHNKEEVANKSR